MSTTHVTVTLPSGNRAVYEVRPQDLTQKTGIARREWVRQYGRQVAHELNGVWHAPGGWTEIHGQELIKALEKQPHIND